MSSNAPRHHSAQEMIDALKVARDRARVQAHLFSLDARKRWQGLEASFSELEATLTQSGEKMAVTAAANFREVSQAVKDLMSDLDGSLALTTPVSKLMKDAPSTCSAEEPLNRAAQIMWDLDCGAVPVIGAAGQLVGIITDRDLCMAAYTRGQGLGAMTVESAMSQGVCSCSPDDSIGHALRLMAERQVRRIPVTADGKLVGMLTLADVARDIRTHGGTALPSCMALAHTLAAISEHRPQVPAAASVAAE